MKIENIGFLSKHFYASICITKIKIMAQVLHF